MSGGRRETSGPAESSKARPDYFGFYASEIVDLVSKPCEFSKDSKEEVRDKKKIKHSGDITTSLFSNSVGAEWPPSEQEALAILLKESVTCLTSEVEEMVHSVLAMCNLRSQLRSKMKSTNCSKEVSAKDADTILSQKIHASSISIHEPANPSNCGTSEEVESDMQFLLQNDKEQVEEIVQKYVHELSTTLGHMERQLEKLLDAVMSKCRLMTSAEKQMLKILIEKLPHKNLDRIFEIIQHHTPMEKELIDGIFVDLEKKDNATLWRSYFSVKAVEKC